MLKLLPKRCCVLGAPLLRQQWLADAVSVDHTTVVRKEHNGTYLANLGSWPNARAKFFKGYTWFEVVDDIPCWLSILAKQPKHRCAPQQSTRPLKQTRVASGRLTKLTSQLVSMYELIVNGLLVCQFAMRKIVHSEIETPCNRKQQNGSAVLELRHCKLVFLKHVRIILRTLWN